MLQGQVQGLVPATLIKLQCNLFLLHLAVVFLLFDGHPEILRVILSLVHVIHHHTVPKALFMVLGRRKINAVFKILCNSFRVDQSVRPSLHRTVLSVA